MNHSEPHSQKQSLDKRELRLRRAIVMMESVEKLQKAAEGVRAAQLLLLKAEFELIRYSDAPSAKRMRNINKKRVHWQNISVETILMQYAGK